MIQQFDQTKKIPTPVNHIQNVRSSPSSDRKRTVKMCDPLPDLVVIDLKNFSPIRSVRARDIYSDGCKRGEKKLSGVRRKMAFEVF